MRNAVSIAFLLAAALAACQRPATQGANAASDPAAQRIRADVQVLAADAMQGRQTGTPGYDKAAAYVAQRMRAAGLWPAGDGGTWLQRVPLLRATRVEQGAQLAITHNGQTTTLRYRDQYLPAINFDASNASIEAPAVFVGQGVQAPEIGYDDFAGVDLHGKIAVLFSGAPAGLDNDRRAFYSALGEKLHALAQRGAVGAVFVNTAMDEASLPWARTAQNWQRSGMRLRDASGRGIDTYPQLRVVATINAASADALLVGSGKTVAALVQAAAQRQMRAFDLPARVRLAASSRIERIDSHNVVGLLPGGGDALAREHIVYTAHLDHLGVGEPVNGDTIYNGALDNALGVSILLEAARRLAGLPLPPKRSLLFVALTAEEQGLLGAQWFVSHPPHGRRLVANLNMDMPVLLAPSIDVVPIGVEHSTLQDLLQQAAKEETIALSPDPYPEEVAFVRSDQYPFIRAGIPAVYLDAGVISADGVRDPKLALRKFMREHYHQPSDDTRLPIAYGDAARLARLNARIGQLAGNAPAAPRWNPGDFFGERFAKPTALPSQEIAP